MDQDYRHHLAAVHIVDAAAAAAGIDHRRVLVSNPRKGRKSRNRRSCMTRWL